MEKYYKKLAWIESLVNVLSGLLLSILIVQPIVFGIFSIKIPITSNIMIAIIFTIVSVIRGYIWRRYFHKLFYSKVLK